MKVFTALNGKVTEGAKTEKIALKGAGVEIDAIVVGEEGRGRARGVLPVQGATGEILTHAVVGQTKSGRHKLIAQPQPGDGDACIVVFRTEGGFRGGASHTGDRNGLYDVDVYGDRERRGISYEDAVAHCQATGVHLDNLKPNGFLPFPGCALAEGMIADGAAGRMGGNKQIVAVMPRGVWFRTGYSGRLYGKPTAHYYRFDGDQLIAVTWDERQLMEETA